MELFKLLGTIAITGADTAKEQIDSVTERAASTADKIGENFEKLGAGISKTGTKLSIGLTTPLTWIGKKAITATADFESAMSEVAAISGATGEDFTALENKAKEMGESTKFSATESAEALKYMAMAGWKTEDMLSGLEGIMNLAAASGENLGTTSDIVTDALTAFGLSASDSGHFADILATASSNANTNVSMMGETFKYVAPVAGALGYSAEDTAFAIGLMANSGIKASQAGTSLRASLSRMVNPTDDMVGLMMELGLATMETANIVDDGKLLKAQQKVEDKTIALEKAQEKYNAALEKYGEGSSQAQTAAFNLEKAENNLEKAVTNLEEAQMGEAEAIGITNNLLVDSAGNMRSLRDVMEILRESFSGLSEEEQAQTAAILFGQEAMSGMLAIINSSETDFNKLADAIDNCDGSTKQMADTMNDNLLGQITILKSQLEGLAIQFVTLVMPFLKQFVEWLSNICTWISNLDDGTKKLIIVIGGLLAAAGPVLIFMGKITASIGSIIKIGSSLIGGIGKVSGSVTGLIGTGGKLLTGIGSVVSKIIGVLIPAITSINPVVVIIVVAITGLIAIGSALCKNWDEVSAWASEAWGAVKETVSSAASTIKDTITSAWSSIKEFTTDAFNSIRDSVLDIWDSIKNGVFGVLDNIELVIGNTWENIKNTVSTALDSIKNIISNIWDNIKDIVSSVMDSIKSVISNAWDTVKDVVSNAISEVKTAISSGLEAARETVFNVLDGIGEKFSSIFERAKNIVSGAIDSIKGMFNFDWKLPDIKLPHFSIDGEFSLMPPSIPHIGVEWYEKAMNNPMIMNEPTIFGYNAESGKFMGGGEAGSEIVSGTDTLMGMIQNAVANQNGELIAVLVKILNAIVSMDESMGENLREALAGTAFEINRREFGRLVKAVN